MAHTRSILQAPSDLDSPKYVEQCQEGSLPCQFEATNPPENANRYIYIIHVIAIIEVENYTVILQLSNNLLHELGTSLD